MAGRIAAIAFVLLWFAPAVQAQSGLRYSATVFAQMNPRALALDLRTQYRQSLGSDASFGAYAGLTSAPGGLLRPNLGLEFQPFAYLTLGVGYAASWYFGLLQARSYPSPHSDYGSGVLSSPQDGPNGSYSLLVHQLNLSATLQGPIGPVVARNATRALRSFADLHGNDSVFYDPALDVAVYRDGWVAQNETDVLYSWRPDLAVGLRHTLTLAWYPSSAYLPGESTDNPDTPISKLGPLALYRVFENQRGARGDLLVAAQWYLLHRFRTGETVSGAFPLLAVGLVVSGDLQPAR